MIQVNIKDYGAEPDRKELQTEAVQAAIEACREKGGGEILIPAGTYRIGSIRLYSHMTLHLLEGARLEGSKDYRDYQDCHVPSTLRYVKDEEYIRIWNLPPYYVYGMICAFEAQEVSIIGEKDSVIDGQDCHLETGDDCFAGYDVQELKVTDCYANTACNFMRIGGCHMLFERCTFEGPGHYPHISENTYYTHAVFKYYAVRPDEIPEDSEDITFRGCRISGAARLLSYSYREKGLHQDNRPLRSLCFEDTEISDMEELSFFKGNGEACRLIFRRVKLELKESNHPFLEIDSSISLELDQVSCNRKLEILAEIGTALDIRQSPQADVMRK